MMFGFHVPLQEEEEEVPAALSPESTHATPVLSQAQLRTRELRVEGLTTTSHSFWGVGF